VFLPQCEKSRFTPTQNNRFVYFRCPDRGMKDKRFWINGMYSLSQINLQQLGIALIDSSVDERSYWRLQKHRS
jgi:hypothetical protein